MTEERESSEKVTTMPNTQDPHDPLECDNSASDDSGACSCQRLHLRNVKHTHNASAVDCSALSTLSLCLCLCLCFSLSMAAPQTSCILCNKEDLRAREPTISGSYEEFTFDHQVSREEAIQALRRYNGSKAHSHALLKAVSLLLSISFQHTIGTALVDRWSVQPHWWNTVWGRSLWTIIVGVKISIRKVSNE